MGHSDWPSFMWIYTMADLHGFMWPIYIDLCGFTQGVSVNHLHLQNSTLTCSRLSIFTYTHVDERIYTYIKGLPKTIYMMQHWFAPYMTRG